MKGEARDETNNADAKIRRYLVEQGLIFPLTDDEIEFTLQQMEKEKTVLLIAAAPEMYEALECIETAIGYAKEMSANYVLEKQDVDLILSALAKARGENTNQPQG